MDEFEGMFETARVRREKQQRSVTTPGRSMNTSATDEAQQRMYGAILSPRVIKPSAESWTRVAPYDKDLYRYGASDKIASNYSPRAANLALQAVTTTSAFSPRPPQFARSPATAPLPAAHTGTISDDTIPDVQTEPETAPTELSKDQAYRFASLMEGVDAADIAPIKSEWLNNVMGTLPYRLVDTAEGNPRLADSLVNSIVSDYESAMRRSIVDYVLTQPQECERLEIAQVQPWTAERETIDSSIWHDTVVGATQIMQHALFITNPVMVGVLDAWQKYDGLSLVADECGLLAAALKDVERGLSGLPCSLPNFVTLQTEHRERMKRLFEEDWMPEITNLFHELHSEWAKPANSKQYLPQFFASVSTLLSNQLRSVVLRSVDQWVKFFDMYVPAEKPAPVSAPQVHQAEEDAYSGSPESVLPTPCALSVELVWNLKENQVEISPSFTEIERQVSELFEKAAVSLSEFRRVEAQLFAADGSSLNIPGPSLDEEVIDDARENVVAIIRQNEHRPVELCDMYQELAWVLDGSAEAEVAELLSRRRPLPDYAEQIGRLSGAILHVETELGFPASMGGVDVGKQACPLHLVEVQCADLNTKIIKEAKEFIEKILSQIASDLRKDNDEIIKKFSEMQKTLEKEATTTDKLVEQMTYMDSAQKVDVPKLVVELKACVKKFDFLVQNSWEILEDDLDTNATAFSWPERIKPEFEKVSNKLVEERERFEDQVKKRVDDFGAAMSELKTEIEKLQEIGDKSLAKNQLQDMVARIKTYQEQLEEALDNDANKPSSTSINTEEEQLGWVKTDFTDIADSLELLKPLGNLWNSASDIVSEHNVWMSGPFVQLTAESIKEVVDQTFRDMKGLKRTFKDLKAPLEVATAVAEKMETFQDHIPLIEYLCHPGLRDRHWEEMEKVVGYSIKPDEFATLTRIIEQRLEPFLKQFEEISFAASKEYNLEKSLDTMGRDWEEMNFPFSPYSKNEALSVIGNLDDIQMLLDDHIVKTQTMKSNSFIGPFEARTKEWETTLLLLQDAIDVWLKVQATWMYLEPIFGSEDIMKQMPAEGKMFQTVDAYWKDIMTAATADPKVLVVVKIPNLFERLAEANGLLENIQKGLNDYLETKRVFFARFFFLSNEELLEILSETKDPLRVQPHLKKCFEGISSLDFQPNLDVTGMFDRGKERVNFMEKVKPVEAKGAVEKWLLQTEQMMRKSMKDVVIKSTEDYTTDKLRTQWVLDWSGQAILAVAGLYWTSESESAITGSDGGPGGSKGLKAYADVCNQQLLDIVILVRGKLTNNQRSILGALVTLDVHARDTLVELSTTDITDIHDFNWTSQLRYYLEDGNGGVKGMGQEQQLKCKMINAILNYGYEYLGNSFRLVVTPLTDRCYRTLMGALHLHYGGAPEGPAGTGKTETTKDLAKALAKQCVVFNCSDGLDYLAMAKFFKGLGASGAWACFDEFNRIKLEVLSVVAQQVLCILRAIEVDEALPYDQDREATFDFEGTILPLDPTCCPFITMNPGYAGRSDLPDNLKVLFRTVAMMVPNYTMIAQIQLMSCGYLAAEGLAVKITTTYTLCSEQLSSQKHYDYGMRAVKAVLTASASLKQRYPDDDEAVLVLRAIRDVNVCKFLSFDIPLFNGITADLFPGTVLPEPDYENLNAALASVTAELKLQFGHAFHEKCIQLYEMICCRHGLMIVGRPFGAKTSMLRVLSGSLTQLHEKGQNDENITELIILNPKSIKMDQLYGVSDPVSQEWQDGVLSNQFRIAANRTDSNRKWVILDGPVDAIWIENMNTVLDDNKKLCLNSGEIVQMSDTMNMIFEVRDLEVASPATVSRCGMIFVEPEEMGWDPMFQSWMQARPEFMEDAHKEALRELITWLVPPVLDFHRLSCKEVSKTLPQTLVISMLRLIDSLLDVFRTEAVKEMPPKETAQLIESSVLFALVWSICASVDSVGRTTLDEYVRVLSSSKNSKFPPPPNRKIQTPFPDRGTIYDYVSDAETGKWQPWKDRIDSKPVIDKTVQYNDIIVPTVDTCRYAYLLELLQTHNVPVLFVGPTGTGKSAYTSKKLANGMPEEYGTITVTFSAQTSANQTQDIIDGKLDKRRKGIFGPPPGHKMIVFVDDLNMPTKEEYGAQPPIEILRQYMDHTGWYDRKETTFRNLVDVQFVAAMGLPEGGRSVITERYSRHFNHISVTDFDDDTLCRIFEVITEWHVVTCHPFASEVAKLSKKLVGATLKIYKAVMKQMLPTPSKSHYAFNLRDFSRVFQGICQTRPEQIPDSETTVRLWVHEVYRVFYDRLTTHGDRDWFFNYTKDAVKDDFGKNMDKLFEHLSQTDGLEGVSEKDMLQCMFGNYANPAKRAYAEITDFEGLNTTIESLLEDYNSVSKTPMPLVLFNFCLQHISKICRILSLPGGNGLLVGVGGSGRQSLTKLASHIQDYDVFSIEISKNYAYGDWLEDLKKVLMNAGAQGKHSVFLFNDTQIKSESFVEDINNLLNAGEVPNLWANDEKATIMESVATAAKLEGKQIGGGMAEHMSYFVNRCRTNLHVMLAFSPVGDAFRERLRMFPSLINCCTIDWFQDWPEEGLSAVAQKALADVDLDDSIRQACVFMCKHFHSSTIALAAKFRTTKGRIIYTTPTSYLELINAFKSLLNKKRSEIKVRLDRYTVGLKALADTESSVSGMKEELIALQPELIKAQGETAEMMVVIKGETESADEVRVVVEAEEAKATESAAEVKSIKDSCEADLAEAIPILNSAVAALDTLKKSDMDEVKSMKAPPAGVKLTMAAICVMKGIKPKMVDDPDKVGKKMKDFWDPAKGLLQQGNAFLQSLKDFDKDNVDEKIIKVIREDYVTNPDFTPENVAKSSKAAEGLCMWCRAIESYDRVAKMVAPKKAMLAKYEGVYTEVMEKLRVKQAELKEVMDKLAGLQAQFAALQKKEKELQDQVELCEQKLIRAEQLISSLGGEKIRWTEVAASLQVKLVNVTGDVLVASGMIAYSGPFTKVFREESLADWVQKTGEMEIPRSDVFSLTATLGDSVQIRDWNIQGLPSDNFSTENAIIVDIGRRWPLMIDPQEQANKWIRKMEASKNLRRIKLSGDFLRTLENCIQFGTPVLLEDIGEELDPSLEPLLLKQVFKQGGMDMIRLGDATIEFSPEFRFYITTKLRNPHYSPETAVKVSLINFMITPEGLEDQLLNIVVAKEREDLQVLKEQLILDGAANARKLKDIEDQILEILSAADNILEDESGIQVLASSKVVANEIEQKQAEQDVTEKSIDETRESYRPIAFHSSVLFFNISDLCIIDPMYQYSLGWFISLFEMSIRNSKKESDVPKRLKNLEDHFTFALYNNICRSLFEKDKLLFSFTLCIALLEGAGKIDLEQYQFLLTGGVSLSENPQRNPASTWLEDYSWDQVCRLGDLPTFEGLNTGFAAQIDGWQAIYDSATPHSDKYPGQWDSNLSQFEKMLVLRCIRPDKITPAIQNYVSLEMGDRYIEPPPFDLKACYGDSICSAPLIFVLSAGSDPMASLLKFADEKKMGGEKTVPISLGQGQGPRAIKLIEDARAKGTWVVLQNCHLAVSFMPQLELLVEQFTTEEGLPGYCDQKFRLWLTSYPSDTFPVSLLQNGVKMTQEPPRGIKANLKRSYLSDPISDELFYSGDSIDRTKLESNYFRDKELHWHKLCFGLCFFHALIQERRSFGPLGWNIPYGFNESDQRICIQQLQMFLNVYEEVPYDALVYTAGECNYGGRVTDDHDRRVLRSYLDPMYDPQILDEKFKFSESGEYYAPPLSDREATAGERIAAVVQYINDLPLVQNPEVFGLHWNADLTKDKNQTTQLFSSILATRTGGAGGGSSGASDELLVEISNGILDKLPADFNLEEISKKYPTDPKESMNTVLVQELIRFNQLTSVIRNSLGQIQLALRGMVVMSTELDAVGTALTIGVVPPMWMNVSYPNLKPLGGYFSDLLERLNFFQTWIENGKPVCFWFSGFFFQPAFLTGALQNFARKYVYPIDACTLDYTFQREGLNDKEWEREEDSVYVYGLKMEGARFNRDTMVIDESHPKVLYDELPVGMLVPMKREDLVEEPHYLCPLYKTLDRRGVLATSGHSTNFVMEVKVPCSQGQLIMTNDPEKATENIDAASHAVLRVGEDDIGKSVVIIEKVGTQWWRVDNGGSEGVVPTRVLKVMCRPATGAERKSEWTSKHWIDRGVAIFTSLDT
jgi:dynein heavy chain